MADTFDALLNTQKEDETLTDLPGITVEQPDFNKISQAGPTPKFDTIIPSVGEPSLYEENQASSTQEFLSLVEHDKKMKAIKDFGVSFGLEADKLFSPDNLIIPIDQLDNEQQAGTTGAALLAKTMAPQKKTRMLPEIIGGTYYQKGLGESLEMIGKGFEFEGIPTAQYFKDLGKKLKDNAADTEDIGLIESWKKSSTLYEKLSGVADFIVKSAESALGSSTLSLSLGLALRTLTKSNVVGIAALEGTNLAMGEGQAMQALEEETQKWIRLADEADALGQANKAKAYRKFSDQFSPAANKAIVRSIGFAIGMIETGSKYISILRRVPDHQASEVKRLLINKFVINVAKKAPVAGLSNALEEATQGFLADVGVIQASGVDEWKRSAELLSDPKKQIEYLEQAAGGFAGGVAIGTVSAGVDTLTEDKKKQTQTQTSFPQEQPQTQQERQSSGSRTGDEIPEIVVPQEQTIYAEDKVDLTPELSSKLNTYIENPENTFRPKDYPAIAEQLDISEDQVPGFLAAAEQEGLIRKDIDGIYRRPATQQAEQIIPETNEAVGRAPVYPKPANIQETSAEELPDLPQPDYVNIPEDLDSQYTNLEEQISKDKDWLDKLTITIKNADSKKRKGMASERQERSSLVQKIAENKKRLESLDELKKEREIRSQPPPTPVVKGKPVVRRSLPETGQTLLNYLIRSGGITVPSSYVGDTRSIYKKAQSLFGKKVPPKLIRPGGRNLDSSGLWDDLVAEQYIPPYLDPDGGPNKYDPAQKITDLLFDEIGGTRVYSDKYDRTQPIDKEKEERDVVNKAQDLLAEAEIPYTLNEKDEERLKYLVLEEGYDVGDALERVAIERSEDGFNKPSAPFEQSAVSEEPTGEGQGSTVQEDDQGERGYPAGSSETGIQEGTEEQRDPYVIPFSIFSSQKQALANKTAANLQAKFKEAIEQFEKIAPEGTDLKIYNKTFSNLSQRLQDYLQRAQEVGSQPEALYDPVQDIVVLSLYGSNPTALVSHEVVHALVRNKLVTRQQISKIAELSKKTGMFTKEDAMEYRQLYRGMTNRMTSQRLNEIIEEEAAARLIQGYAEQRASAGAYKKVLDKIVEFLRLIKRTFSSDLTSLDIVDMILNGDAAKGKLGRYVTNEDLATVSESIAASLKRGDKTNQLLAELNQAEEKIAEKPNPLTAPVRGSIPLLGNTVKPISSSTARMMRLTEGVNDKGIFAPRAELADWMGLPMVRYQADVAHLGKSLKLTPKQAKTFIREVLDNAQFAFKYKNGENWNIVYRTETEDRIVSISPKLTGRTEQQSDLKIVKAFKTNKGAKDAALATSLQENGIEGIRWKKDADGVDRILNIVRQSSGLNEHPSVQETIRELNKEQALLRGVNPEVLAALGKTGDGKKIKGIHTIIRDLAKDLRVTLKQGQGPQYGYRPSGVIRNKSYYDYIEFARNIPSVLMERYNNWLPSVITNNAAELAPLDPQSMDPATGFENFMVLYLTDQNIASQKAPNFYKEFVDNLETKSATDLVALQTAQIAYDELSRADPVAVVTSIIQLPEQQKGPLGRLLKDFKNKGVKFTAKQKLMFLYQATVAREAPIIGMVRKLLILKEKQTGQREWLIAANNPAKIARLLPHTAQMANKAIHDGIMMFDGKVEGPGLGAVIDTAMGKGTANVEPLTLEEGSKYHQFLSYVTALRAKVLWERYARGDLQRPPLPASYKTVTSLIKTVESKYPEFTRAQKQLSEFTRALLKFKYQAGIISKETYDELSKDRFYVPFNRSFKEEEDESVAVTRGKSGQNLTFKFKELKGSGREIIDPIASLTRDVYAAHSLAYQTRMAQTFIAQADAVGPLAGEIVERITPELDQLEVDLKEVARDAGLPSTDTQDLFQQVIAAMGHDTIVNAFSKQKVKAGRKPIILFMENGKPAAIQLNDPMFGKMAFDSFVALGDKGSFLLEAIATPMRIQRAGVTMWPSYTLRNFIADAFYAPVFERRMIPIWSQMSGAYRLIFDKALVDRYLRAGGMMGGYATNAFEGPSAQADYERMRKLGFKLTSVRSWKDLVRAWQKIVETSESATRLEIFRHKENRAKAHGLSPFEQLMEAGSSVNDYCDYSRTGLKMAWARWTIAFINAGIQANDSFNRILSANNPYGSAFKPWLKYKFGKSNPLSVSEKEALKQSYAAWTYMILGLGTFAALVAMAHVDDEDIKDIDERIRQTHFFVKFFGHIIRIPKPFQASLFMNLVERIIWDKRDGDPNWFYSWAEDVISTSTAGIIPTALQWYDVWVNRKDSFTGAPLETDQMKKLNKEDRYTPYTSWAAKKIGALVNESPVVVEAMINSMFATAGRDIQGIMSEGDVPLDRQIIVRRFLWGKGKGSIAARKIQEITGMREPIFGWLNWVKEKNSNLGRNAGSYEFALKEKSLDEANQNLAKMTPRERGSAILKAGSKDKDAKLELLDPAFRASKIQQVLGNYQSELSKKRFITNKGKKKEETNELSSQTALEIKEIMTQLRAIESYNALVLTKELGYANRDYIDASSVYKELEAVHPEVYQELLSRYKSNNVLPWEGIKEAWPKLDKILSSDELYQKAKEGDPRYVVDMIKDSGIYMDAKYNDF